MGFCLCPFGIFFFQWIFIGAELIYNVVLVSAICPLRLLLSPSGSLGGRLGAFVGLCIWGDLLPKGVR